MLETAASALVTHFESVLPVSGNHHGPKSSSHASQIGWLIELLMADPFGPGHRGRAGEVKNRLIACPTIPAAYRLARPVPQKRIAAITDAKAQTQWGQLATVPKLAACARVRMK
jgi:hypothetical protein